MPRKADYIPSLDGLRGVAVVFVLLIHGSYGIFHGGWIGVDLFFVLSGFLITSLLHEEFSHSGKIELGKFYARRVLRLAPPLLVGVLLADVLWTSTDAGPAASRGWADTASLFYFANIASPKLLGPLIHMWSLSVEEHFYLFWPLLAGALLFRMRSRRLLLVLLSLILLAAIARATAYWLSRPAVFENGLITIDPYRFTLYRLGSILSGCLLAIIFARRAWREMPRKYESAGLVLSLMLLSLVALFLDETNRFWEDGGFVGTNALCAIVVALAARNPTQAFLSHPALRWIGRRSYGIYVYHLPIFLACESLRRKHDVVNLLAVSFLRLAATIIFAALSFRYLERPMLRLKSRFEVATLPGSSPL